MATEDINVLKETLKSYLQQYLNSQGINTSRLFQCISPAHKDRKPSMGLVPNKLAAHCFSCGAVYDIFSAAAVIENLPESGPGFVTANLLYLADKFGLDAPSSKFSEKPKELQTFRAYSHAAQIIKNSKLSRMVVDKLAYYGWTLDMCRKLGVGSVTSYQEYIDTMVVKHKWQPEFLKEVDLDNKLIFQSNNLIYTIKDEFGAPVAFAARDLQYEQKLIEYESKKSNNPSGNFFVPSKYINSSAKSGIYNKSKTLYLFDQSKQSKGALLIVEGQADTVSMYAAGITSVAGICSTAFTKDHLESITRAGIKHIIFVLDPDTAGQKATDKYMKMAEEFCLDKDIRIEAIVLPDNKDPDEYIRSFNSKSEAAKAIRSLPRIDSFTWELDKSIDLGEDIITLCDRILLRIVKEPNNIIRLQMADQLADVTKQDKEYVRKELLRLLDNTEALQSNVSSVMKIIQLLAVKGNNNE